MAGRGRTSYQKRQKEQARLERRQRKAERRDARKAAAKDGPQDTLNISPDNPQDSLPESDDYESQQPAADR